MTTSLQSDFENLSLDLARQVEQQCQRFETAWKANERPRIEVFVADVPEAGRAVLLRELIVLDVLYRRNAGEPCRSEYYQERFPKLDASWLAGVVAEPAHAPTNPPENARIVDKEDAETLPPSLHAPVGANDTSDDHGDPATPSAESAVTPAKGSFEDSWPSIPGYEILGELGRGGMGVVYKARHVTLNRLVALKLIQAHAWSDEHWQARFCTEAEAVARLQHPNVVQIFEIGEQDGRPFLALEYASGGSLDEKLKGTPLPPAEAAGMVEVLARAVHATHQIGVIHRDLKPANVLLTADGTLKITDFGLAKKLDTSLAHTQSGHIVGTPSYMAPEQAAGKNREIGPGTDVYALGAILYELLTGRPPFKAATPIDTVLQVLQDEPVPPRQLQPRTPRDLETICLKCLKKEPALRYASAAALASDLRRFLDGEPIRARPVPWWEHAVYWTKREPLWAVMVAPIIVTVMIVLPMLAASIALLLLLAVTLVRARRAVFTCGVTTLVLAGLSSYLYITMQPSNLGEVQYDVNWFHYLVAFNILAWLTAFYSLISRGIAWYLGASAWVTLFWAIVGTILAFCGYLIGVGLATAGLFEEPLAGAQFRSFIWVWPWPVRWATLSLIGAIGGAVLGASRQKWRSGPNPLATAPSLKERDYLNTRTLRGRLRATSLVLMVAFGAVLISAGFNSPIGGRVPLPWLGFFFVGYALLGLFGVNVWSRGPLDPRFDQRNQNDNDHGQQAAEPHKAFRVK
jgi:hypothetical protein